ncbi:DNA/RNA non-specific endonuclease [Brevibacillus sp. B_LB10_24]|uniref:DNA/RNA non-specific endonuclease n=1 Tax=Brevibacillus sp. B_LB10_24 TaxID=3380645 RepID=UPI0038B85BD5
MTGYDPLFLGEEVPLPLLQGKTAEDALQDGRVYDFTHFSIVMNARRRFAVFSAACVDEGKFLEIPRNNKSWHFDERIGAEYQVGPEYYVQNDYDRGHLTRRKDVCWGTRQEAEKANYDSFCYANIALQHHNFNTGIWNCLEDWILYRLKNEKKMLVITGPIYKETDEEYCGVNGRPGCRIQVPFGFWKSVFFVNTQNRITNMSFLIRQSPDHLNEACEYQRLETYQVPLSTITRETGLLFKPGLYEANPLFVAVSGLAETELDTAPVRQVIHQAADLIMER